MTVLDIQQLTKIYGDKNAIKTTALKEINLTISNGEFMAISGPSGSGKTTLLNMMGGLDQPNEGVVLLNNQTMTGLKESQLAHIRLHHIGFVFQSYNLIPVLTAMENIEYVLMLQGIDSRQRRKQVKEIAVSLDIDDLLDKRPNEMSGGQQQRVAVARAIVSHPQLVLADEPTANLDSVTGDRLMTLMQRLNRDYNITFIFATHDTTVIEKSIRHIQLKDGVITHDDTP